MSIVAGPSLRINTASGNVGTHTETASGAFNITSDTFTFDGMTWTLRAGNFKGQTANTVAKTLYLTRRENAKCISAVTATKELP
jgi:hypothetical protein